MHHDEAWHDGQYNVRARIPDHAQIFARWAARSAAARGQCRSELDLAYGDGPNETLDVFPAARDGAPILVFVHGGYWRSLDKRDHSFVAPPFVEGGAMVVVPNYALCPAVSVATIALQLTRALAWTFRHAARHGGNPARIVVAGHSAGGHLAAMLLACRWQDVAADLPRDLVKAALAISGLYDLAPIARTPYLQCDLHLTAADVQRLSPARFAPPERGRLFAVVGGAESEEFRRQNRLIRNAWGETRVPVCEEVVGVHHLGVVEQLAVPTTRLHGLAGELLGAT